MKQLELQVRLWHILNACEKILRYTSGKTLDDYLADDFLASAVERQLTIVGEAVANIARSDTTVAAEVGDFPRIIGFRNILIHNYPDIENNAVWVIVQREIPILLHRVRAILDRPESGAPPA
jgi:uncharacterized protein with HEPN domain